MNWTIQGHAVAGLTQISAESNWDRMNLYGKGIWVGEIALASTTTTTRPQPDTLTSPGCATITAGRRTANRRQMKVDFIKVHPLFTCTKL